MNPSNQVSSSPHNGPGDRSGQSGQYDHTGNAFEDMSGQGREVATSSAQLQRSEPVVTVLPPVDIFEDEAGFTVIADLPGVSKDRLNVQVTGDSLVIEGTASAPADDNMELIYGEALNRQYRRSFTLSRELDPGKIEARLNNGVLRLRIAKVEEARPRRINVSVV